MSRSSCSLLGSASSGLLPSFDIDRSMADLQIQTFVVGGAESQRIADSPLSWLPETTTSLRSR